MYQGLLHLHNLLRWIILILLLLTIWQSFRKDRKLQKTGLWLMITSHITLLLGIYQWLNGELGLSLIEKNGMGEVMKTSVYRFWAIEHITAMFIAIILITIARGSVKDLRFRTASWLYVTALVLILISIPWPFRVDGIARPWLPGM
jgi:hypothetical protein